MPGQFGWDGFLIGVCKHGISPPVDKLHTGDFVRKDRIKHFTLLDLFIATHFSIARGQDTTPVEMMETLQNQNAEGRIVLTKRLRFGKDKIR